MRFSDIMNSYSLDSTPLLEGIRMSRKQYQVIENDEDILVGFEAEFRHNEYDKDEMGGEGGLVDTLEEARDHPDWDEGEAERMQRSWWWGDEYEYHGRTIKWNDGYRFEWTDNEGPDLKEFFDDHVQIGDVHQWLVDGGYVDDFLDYLEEEGDDRIEKAKQEIEDGDMEELEAMEEFFEWKHIDKWLLDDEGFPNDRWEIREFLRDHSNTTDAYYEEDDRLREEWLEENEDMDAFWDKNAYEIAEAMELYSTSMDERMGEFTAELEIALDVPIVHYQDYHADEKNGEDWYLEPDGSTEWELISPPMRIPEAREALRKVFDYIEEKGDTDSTTGLHMSVSIDGLDADDYDLFKLIMVVAEEHVVKVFNRENEHYATPQIRGVKDMLHKELGIKDGETVTSKDLADLMKGDEFKELTRMVTQKVMNGVRGGANVAHLEDKGYIEFRMAGDNYHTDFNLAEETMLRYAFAMKVASDPDMFRKEYLTSVVKFLNGILGIEAGAKGKGKNPIQAVVDAVNKGRLMAVLNNDNQMLPTSVNAFKKFVAGEKMSDNEEKYAKNVLVRIADLSKGNLSQINQVRKVQKHLGADNSNVVQYVNAMYDENEQINAKRSLLKALQIAA